MKRFIFFGVTYIILEVVFCATLRSVRIVAPFVWGFVFDWLNYQYIIYLHDS